MHDLTTSRSFNASKLKRHLTATDCDFVVTVESGPSDNMANIWARFRRWTRSGRHRQDARLAARAQSEPNMTNMLIPLGDNDSLSSQRVLAPSTSLARNADRQRALEAQHRQSMPIGCKTDSILLAWPEHQLARQRRQNLDEAVPRELQQSKVSCDLHDLTSSAQAGRRPYCEDVADRNISSSETLYLSGRQDHPARQTQHISARRQARMISKPPCSYMTNTKAFKGGRYSASQPHTRCDQGNQFSADDVPLKRSRSTHSSSKCAHATEERRHSLPHKPNIFDLRNATEAEEEQLGARIVCERQRSDSGISHRSSLTRARLNAPLPPLPRSGSPTDRRAKGGSDQCQQRPQMHDQVVESQIRPNSPSPGHLGSTTGTTVYERWVPAVTHDTITTNTHEIREEHVSREIHNYHVKPVIQPIIDYEILSLRHFVQEGDEIREIGEDDIPSESPSADWYTAEVASQLDSLSVQDVPWDRTSDPGSRCACISHGCFSVH